jgi:hypothetical protein
VTVFKASVVPEAVVPEAVELGAAEAELGAAEAEAVVFGLVLVPPAADEVEVLLQAAASIATAAIGRPQPSVRSEVLRGMKNLPCRCEPIADPHMVGHSS